MLDRIKKRQFDGFKELVLNMETTGTTSRQQIFMMGILEDPVFMTYVMKNVRTFEDFLNLPSDEIDAVIRHQDQVMGVMAKCIFGIPDEKIISLESTIPKHMSKLKDELSYLKEVTPSEKEGARYFIMKIARKLQLQESINGFKWQLPPLDLFYPKFLKDGNHKIHFESGVLAAEGEIVKGKRCGFWKHYYDSGKLLAEGDYIDGLKSGVWVFYYGNSNIKSYGHYISDLKQGAWKEWDRFGQLTEAEFQGGVKKTT